MRKLAFMQDAQADDAVLRFNRAIRSRAIISLVGTRGTGKSQLLEYWAVQEAPRIGIDTDQIVLVKLIPPSRASLGKERLTSPATLIAFSRVWHVLQKLSGLTHREWLETLDQDVARLYTDPQFLALFEKIEQGMRRRHIRAVLIDNAQYLDDRAFQWLIHLWDDCDQQFGIILCAQMKANEQPNEPLKEMWRYVPHAREYHTDALVLSRMTHDVFRDPVLLEVFIDLAADVGPEVAQNYTAIADRLWQHTLGDWHSITRVATLFDEELGHGNGGPRMITQDVVDQVFARL